MRMDKLTSKFQQALADAQSIAVGRDHQFIEPIHLLLALLDQQGGTTKHLLTQSAVDINVLRSKLAQELEQMAQIQNNQGDVQISPTLSKVLNLTDKLSQQRHDQFILIASLALTDFDFLRFCQSE